MNIITFQCFECGLIYKALFREGKDVSFSCMDKLHSEKQLILPSGYFKCIHCKGITKIRFEKVLKGK